MVDCQLKPTNLTWLVEVWLSSWERRAANQMQVLATGATRPKRRKCLYLMETRERGNWTWWESFWLVVEAEQ